MKRFEVWKTTVTSKDEFNEGDIEDELNRYIEFYGLNVLSVQYNFQVKECLSEDQYFSNNRLFEKISSMKRYVTEIWITSVK